MSNLNFESGQSKSQTAPLTEVTDTEETNLGQAFEDAARLVMACKSITHNMTRKYTGRMICYFYSVIFLSLFAAYVLPRLGYPLHLDIVPLAVISIVLPTAIGPFIQLRSSRKQMEALVSQLRTSDYKGIELPGDGQAFTEERLRHEAIGAVWQILPGVKMKSRDALFSDSQKREPIRQALSEVLARWLCQVKRQDAHPLDDFDTVCFSVCAYNVMKTKLEKDYDEPLLMACINAAAEFGKEDTVLYFEQIMSMKATSELQLRIKTAVASRLPELKFRWLKESQGDRLLRAAEAETDSVLLRPAASGTPSDAATLVRSSE